MSDLSILIPARNEEFLSETVEDILKNIEGDTDIIVVLDGQWPIKPLPVNPKLFVVFLPQSRGQRVATNIAARLSHSKYLMKCDAHCAFDKGFDVKMMKDMQDDWTMVPVMKNLHVFNWKCPNGHIRYQGPSGNCQSCDLPTEKEIVWIAKPSPNSTAFRFDKNMVFQYWGEYKERQVGQLVDTLTIQGSCFMVTREKYFELDLCSEEFSSWGQQGVEVSCKTWLSGGRVVCNKNTWYAHMFRTQGGDFSFPYPNSQKKIDQNRELSRELFMRNKWPGAKLIFEQLLDKFYPIPDWHKTRDKKVEKGVVYYTDSQLDESIATTVRAQIKKGIKEKHIVSVSLKPLDFGFINISIKNVRGYLTMAKQILAGLMAQSADVVFFCEHDVLYHPSHFDFIPPDPKKIYYNTNVWKFNLKDKYAVRVDDCRQLSGLCSYKDVLIEHFQKRVNLLSDAMSNMGTQEFNRYVRKMGFEPGTHNRYERVDDLESDIYESKYPNVDIRHENNLTPTKWSPDKFRNKKFSSGWTKSEKIPGWEINSLYLGY